MMLLGRLTILLTIPWQVASANARPLSLIADDIVVAPDDRKRKGENRDGRNIENTSNMKMPLLLGCLAFERIHPSFVAVENL